MKLLLSLFFILTTAIASVSGFAISLSPNARISVLTNSPYDDVVYALYGHSSIRVLDVENRIDAVFNWGIFDFSAPNFIWRFAFGETDYILACYDFNRYFIEYQEKKNEVYEQVLNLLPEEKESLWQALVLNASPENKVYRYNFFFDNCATRPIAMIEKNINGTIRFQGVEQKETFRHAINYLTREHEWLTLGCDIVLGAPTDRVMTPKERLFLPGNLKDYLSQSVIIRDGVSQPAVTETNVLMQLQKPALNRTVFSSPLICFGILFGVIFALTLIERRLKKHFGMIDRILFFIAGTGGCIVFFLCFISVHPSMFPNINVLWLHPFHLMGVLFFSIKKFKKPAFWFHFINFAAIFVMCVAWFFVPQHFNITFIPLIAILLLRSGEALLRKKLLTE